MALKKVPLTQNGKVIGEAEVSYDPENPSYYTMVDCTITDDSVVADLFTVKNYAIGLTQEEFDNS